MKTTIKVHGMHCHACETLLKDVLGEVNGVKEAKVSFKDGTAVVEHDAEVTEAQLRAAIEAEGYKTG